ncbi:MAG: two-component regulator propeller domain-containing protein [Thermoanaerobaculia bacterium]|nr:two-component regulator propeller domain-containing protein [Thermoanaerobaculia bacterium]
MVLGLATSVAADTRPIRFDHLSLEDGLSQAAVLSVHQDGEGYMWFGSEDGLNRYDGRSFVHYEQDPFDPATLRSDFIWDLEEDADGNLWVATADAGLAKWERASDRFVSFRHDPADPNSLSSNAIRALHIDDEGMLWIATRTTGLDRLDPASGTFTHYRHDPAHPDSLASDEVYAISSGSFGGLWIGTNGGLARFDAQTGEFTTFRNDPADAASLGENRVRSVLEDRQGFVWVGTHQGGLFRLDPDTGVFRRFRHDPSDATSLSSDWVRVLFEDAAGGLWVGTVGGLNRLSRESGTFTSYVHNPADPNSLADDEVMSIFQDRTGILWVGTRSGGVSRWNLRTWEMGHRIPEPAITTGRQHRNVSSFSEDRAGRLWVGTFGDGIKVINRITGAEEHYSSQAKVGPRLNDDRIMALLHDHQGFAWIGTLSGGLTRFDQASGRSRVYRHDPDDPGSLSADAIMSLFEDRAGQLWVGTFGGGVSRLDRQTGSFVRYLPDAAEPSSFNSARATSFAQDPSGTIWIGTDGGGLNVYLREADAFVHLRHRPEDPRSLSSDTVYSLHVDGSGALWVGTRAGLNRLEGQVDALDSVEFVRFSQKDGLADDVVYGIQSDGRGSLWLSTNRGLSRLRPESGEIKNYHRGHGLQSSEFNFGAHYRSTSGELFFGGLNGFNGFFPHRLESNPHAPPVVLTSVTINGVAPSTGQPAGTIRSLELDHRDDLVTLEVAALDFAAPEENRYAYLLEGLDREWVDLGTRNRITFTDLDKGRYTLRIRGANSDGVWNQAGLPIAITVRPAPWESWWAYCLYALAAVAVGGSSWWAQRRRLAREVEYSRTLEEEVQARTKELADRNSELQAVNNQLLEASLTDSLTGLRNRRFLFDQVSKDIAMVRRRYYDLARGVRRIDANDLVFMMVDLDHFKAINDSCGHAAGDRVLLDVRDVLRSSCRESDIIIRWGGDEFLVIARDSQPAQAEKLAERIRSRIDERVIDLGDGQVVRTTCSIGFACYPFQRAHPDLATWEQVLSLADGALYAAKKRRNAWVGYLSTPASVGGESHFWSIREEPERCVEEGLLEVRASASPETEAEAS